MTNTPLRVAVIGLGNMGQYHVKHWKDIPNTQLVAVVDSDPERIARHASDTIIGFQSISDLLASHCVDAVSITTPTSFHFEHAKQCLLNGIHTLIEKPIATTLEEGQELIETAKTHHCQLQVGHIERFNPAIITLLSWASDQVLGAPISISTERMSPLPPQIKDADVMIDLAVHDLDIVSALIGETPLWTTAAITSAQLDDRADSAMVTLQYPSAIAVVSVGWNSPVKRRKLVGYFKRGMVELDFIAQSLHFYPTDPAIAPLQYAPSAQLFPLELELASFASAIQSNTPIAVSGEDGVLALKLALDAKQLRSNPR